MLPARVLLAQTVRHPAGVKTCAVGAVSHSAAFGDLIYALVTSNLPSQLDALLARHDPDVQALALALRDLVLDELAPCHEYAFQMRSKTVLLYGATAHALEDNMCNIALLRKHVTLTFRHGASSAIRMRYCAGTGKIMQG